MDTLAIADAQREIKALVLQIATEMIKGHPSRAKIGDLLNRVIAQADATLDTHMAYKPDLPPSTTYYSSSQPKSWK